jgi:predicted component of type VI protein secretion system
MGGNGRCAGAGAGDDEPVLVALDQRLAELRAAHHAGESQLVATGEEHSGRLTHLLGHPAGVRLLARHRPHAVHLGGAELVEQGPVQVSRLVAEEDAVEMIRIRAEGRRPG